MAAKGTRRLTDAFCRKTHRPGRYTDGRNNLLFVVSPTGTKRWVFRYQLHGCRREIGLGPYPLVGLAEARERALEARRALRHGRDPKSALRTTPAGPTFREAASTFVEAKQAEWRNAKHRQQWRNTLETCAFPHIGDVPVAAVTVDHVLKVLKPIWETKPETASRLRGRIERILAFAQARGWRHGDNPARWRGHLDQLLARPSKLRRDRHHPSLPWRDAPDFLAELRRMRGLAARALELLVLTAVRSGEVRGARWQEFDLEEGTWTIPADRTKSGREHRVPLGPRALALVRALPRLEGTDLVFPGKNGEMSDNTLLAVVERMNERRRRKGLAPWTDREGHPVTVHGFRSTFRTWAQERTRVPREIAEAALTHVVGDRSERAYCHGDALERRRELMVAWECHLDGRSHPLHFRDRGQRSSRKPTEEGPADSDVGGPGKREAVSGDGRRPVSRRRGTSRSVLRGHRGRSEGEGQPPSAHPDPVAHRRRPAGHVHAAALAVEHEAVVVAPVPREAALRQPPALPAGAHEGAHEGNGLLQRQLRPRRRDRDPETAGDQRGEDGRDPVRGHVDEGAEAAAAPVLEGAAAPLHRVEDRGGVAGQGVEQARQHQLRVVEALAEGVEPPQPLRDVAPAHAPGQLAAPDPLRAQDLRDGPTELVHADSLPQGEMARSPPSVDGPPRPADPGRGS